MCFNLWSNETLLCGIPLINQFQIVDFDKVNDLDKKNAFKRTRKLGYDGFADFYLAQFINKCKSDDEIDGRIYTKFVEIDRSLGTTTSEQLLNCLLQTTRSDIIKV